MEASYQLSPEEFGVFSDQKFMPLKQQSWQKLESILSLLAEKEVSLIREYAGLIDEQLDRPMPKISRGENYHSYSYRVLDYPRILEKEHMFLFRTMLLWGHPIGFHLILSGRYQEAYAEKLLNAASELDKEIFYSAENSPWLWEHDSENMIKLGNNTKIRIEERSFFKLSSFLPISDYHEIPVRGADILQTYLRILTS